MTAVTYWSRVCQSERQLQQDTVNTTQRTPLSGLLLANVRRLRANKKEEECSHLFITRAVKRKRACMIQYERGVNTVFKLRYKNCVLQTHNPAGCLNLGTGLHIWQEAPGQDQFKKFWGSCKNALRFYRKTALVWKSTYFTNVLAGDWQWGYLK